MLRSYLIPRQVAAKPRLHTTQGHHIAETIRVRASDGRQQLTVEIAEITAEGLPLVWVRVDLQGVALHEEFVRFLSPRLRL